ncbi:hypothetical protein ACNI3Q_09380 [Sphingomonas sp. FW199]|uniref:DUF4129 domain-containing protein n=1 Tax=Sphingomonas sp. FW199 TaxID=3400217 RepID=UPI003CF9E286
MTVTNAPDVTQAAPAPPAPFPDPARFDGAYDRVRADPSIQFDLPFREVKPDPPPKWLLDLIGAIGRFIEWAGPVWSWLFWIVLALLIVLLIVVAVPSLRQRLKELVYLRRRRAQAAEPVHWAPTTDAARQLLAEADALATAGRYEEAVRLLLHRSIEDIQRWRGELVRPSQTSRDIAALDALPGEARPVFGRIVAVVERSLFAGRALARSDWESARGDYARFALKGL